MNSRTFAALASTPFVTALALLIANDFIFKAAFGNWITGKLSDFAGLFAAGFFCAVLWPRSRLRISVAITVTFAYWKSPFSTPLIDWLATFVPVARTIDFTDLMAIPAAWHGCAVAARARPWSAPRSARVGIALVSLAAFTATSMVPPALIRQAVEFERPAGVSAAAQEEALTRVIDDFASRHGFVCTICEGVAQGRVYESSSADQFTATFDAASQMLYLNATPRKAGKKAEARTNDLLAELRDALQAGGGATSIRTFSILGHEDLRYVTATVTLELGEPTLQPASVEAARRTVSQFIEYNVRRYDMRAGNNSYSLGKRYGPDDFAYEFLMMVHYANAPVVRVIVTRSTNTHESVQRELVSDLEARLRSAIPSARVTATWQP